MDLLGEIATGAVDSRAPLPDLFRKCLLLAARLKNEELRKWVHAELNGYAAQEQLPPYRVISALAKGHILGPGGAGYRNAPIPPSMLPDELQRFADTAEVRQAIATLVELAQSDENEFQLPWPPDLAHFVKVEEPFGCVQGWQAAPRGAIVGIVEAVRNRLLEFVLRIQEEKPDLNSETPPEPQSKIVDQSVRTIIYGDVLGNVAISSENIIQRAAAIVTTNDFESLQAYLATAGIEGEDVAELRSAMEEDQKDSGKPSIGHRTSAWIGKMIGRASAGSLKIGATVAATALLKAIAAYLGIPVP